MYLNHIFMHVFQKRNILYFMSFNSFLFAFRKNKEKMKNDIFMFFLIKYYLRRKIKLSFYVFRFTNLSFTSHHISPNQSLKVSPNLQPFNNYKNTHANNVYSSPIWHNSQIYGGVNKDWFHKGLRYIRLLHTVEPVYIEHSREIKKKCSMYAGVQCIQVLSNWRSGEIETISRVTRET